MGKVNTSGEIANMRDSGKILATILQFIQREVHAGMTPRDVSALAADELKRLGGKPVFKGVDGGPHAPRYPDIICISTNNEVQHSIPNDHLFADGDIVN